ncbi:unnamed protein product [Cunninghamella echinulata]
MSNITKIPNTIKFWYNYRNSKQGIAFYYENGKEEMHSLKEDTKIQFEAGHSMMINIIYNEKYGQKWIKEGTLCQFCFDGEKMMVAFGENSDFFPVHKVDVDGYETILSC